MSCMWELWWWVIWVEVMVGTRSYFRNVARGAFWGGRKGGFKSIMRRWEEVLGVGEGGYGM